MRRDLDRERRSVVVPECAVVHSEVSCSDWLLVSLAALCDLNIFLQKSFLPRSAPGICSSLEKQEKQEGFVWYFLDVPILFRGEEAVLGWAEKWQLGWTYSRWCYMEGLPSGHSLFGCLGGSAGDVATTLICSTGHLTLVPGHTCLWPAHTHTHTPTDRVLRPVN